GGVAWWFTRSRAVDMTAALNANARGIGHLDRFDYKQATIAFEEVLSLAPDWVPGKVNLAIALLNLGGEAKDRTQTERSIELLQTFLRTDPKHPYANHCLGLIYNNDGNAKDAEPCFRKVTEADANDPDAWCWLGKQLLQLGKRDEAKECFTKAYSLNANNKAI